MIIIIINIIIIISSTSSTTTPKTSRHHCAYLPVAAARPGGGGRGLETAGMVMLGIAGTSGMEAPRLGIVGRPNESMMGGRWWLMVVRVVRVRVGGGGW